MVKAVLVVTQWQKSTLFNQKRKIPKFYVSLCFKIIVCFLKEFTICLVPNHSIK